MKHIVLIDNQDSFTYNLVDYFRQLGAKVVVCTNAVSIKQITSLHPDLIVYSPGPGKPAQAGKLLTYIKHFTATIPQFGVCLGMQAMIEVFGGTLQILPRPVHGKAALMQHDGETIFKGIPNPIAVGRYHSLAADIIPEVLAVSARTVDDGTVMAIRHQLYAIEGVQFHPESILTHRAIGLHVLKNALQLCTR